MYNFYTPILGLQQIMNGRALAKDIAIYQSERGEISLRSDLEADNLWITQRQLADVFDVDVRTVNEHILNIFKSDELDENPTIRNFRITAADGKNIWPHQGQYFAQSTPTE